MLFHLCDSPIRNLCTRKALCNLANSVRNHLRCFRYKLLDIAPVTLDRFFIPIVSPGVPTPGSLKRFLSFFFYITFQENYFPRKQGYDFELPFTIITVAIEESYYFSNKFRLDIIIIRGKLRQISIRIINYVG